MSDFVCAGIYGFWDKSYYGTVYAPGQPSRSPESRQWGPYVKATNIVSFQGFGCLCKRNGSSCFLIVVTEFLDKSYVVLCNVHGQTINMEKWKPSLIWGCRLVNRWRKLLDSLGWSIWEICQNPKMLQFPSSDLAFMTLIFLHVIRNKHFSYICTNKEDCARCKITSSHGLEAKWE